MLQVILRLHLFGREIPIYGYGLMLVVALLACILVCKWLLRRSGINPELAVNAALIALITGIAGARICAVLENFRDFTRPGVPFWTNVANILNIRGGGLTFYGGFLLATPCCILYARFHRIPILKGMDIVAPVLMIGLGIGRIGCFLNGCCYGQQCDLPWAVRFPYFSYAYIEQWERGEISVPPDLMTFGPHGLSPLPPDSAEIRGDPQLQALVSQSRALPVHPAEIYSAITAFLLAALLIAYYTTSPRAGRVFALMLILEGISRYVLEMIRVEESVATIHWHGQSYGLSLSMILAIVSIWAGLLMWTLLKTGAVPNETAVHK